MVKFYTMPWGPAILPLMIYQVQLHSPVPHTPPPKKNTQIWITDFFIL